MKEEFDKIVAELKAIKEKRKIIADIYCEDKVAPDYGYAIDYIHSRVDRVVEMIYELYENSYEKWADHMKGHLPNTLSPGEMKKAIDKLGLGDSYEVQKRYVFASDGSSKKLVLEIQSKSE